MHTSRLFQLLTLLFAVGAISAEDCDPSKCKPANNCRCSLSDNPISPFTNAPQFVAITVSESITPDLYTRYLQPLFSERKNADGGKIGVTYYVNHEYTDYTLVNKLYLAGNEIGVHSITKNFSSEYWNHATLDDLVQEFDGQKTILNTFGSIPTADIVGVRTPQLQIEGDTTFEAYAKSGLKYDNSWPTLPDQPLFPYTLDYATSQQCTVARDCPVKSWKGFWVAPITDIYGNGRECNSFVTCDVNGTRAEVKDWLLGEFNRVKKEVRVPLVWRLDSYWFDFYKESYEAFGDFLDEIAKQKDVFVVSVQDVIEWVKNPVALDKYKTPDHSGRKATCRTYNCNYRNADGDPRLMGSCRPCPAAYPWKGNPTGTI